MSSVMCDDMQNIEDKRVYVIASKSMRWFSVAIFTIHISDEDAM